MSGRCMGLSGVMGRRGLLHTPGQQKTKGQTRWRVKRLASLAPGSPVGGANQPEMMRFTSALSLENWKAL